jgi:hypothetical protein
LGLKGRESFAYSRTFSNAYVQKMDCQVIKELRKKGKNDEKIAKE